MSLTREQELMGRAFAEVMRDQPVDLVCQAADIADLPREQEIMSRALADVLRKRQTGRPERYERAASEKGRDESANGRAASTMEVEAMVDKAVDQAVAHAVNGAMVERFARFGPAEVVNHIDVTPLADAVRLDLTPIAEAVSATKVDLMPFAEASRTDMGPVAAAISGMAAAVERSNAAMIEAMARMSAEHAAMIERLLSQHAEAMAKMSEREITVTLPEPRSVTRVVHRDGEGNITSVTEER